MKTIEVNIYKFSELSERAKQTAINNLSDINTNYEWWECVYEDANEIGLKINGFDLDRGNGCSGYLTEDFMRVITLLRNSHGEMCDTYKTADKYLKEYNNLVAKYSDGVKLDTVAEENEYDFDNEADELETKFLNSILGDYAKMLRDDYEYLTSDKAIIETIEANNYEFTEDGTQY